MNARHTPGPWKACINEEACHFRGITRHGWTIDGPQMVPDNECCMFNEADARLIAAAPDLLEFVKEWLDRQGSDENYMTAKARSIIAQATGEEK